MGHRSQDGAKAGSYPYSAVEVLLVKRFPSAPGEDAAVVLTVGNDWDTLNFTKNHMGNIAANLVRVRQWTQNG